MDYKEVVLDIVNNITETDLKRTELINWINSCVEERKDIMPDGGMINIKNSIIYIEIKSYTKESILILVKGLINMFYRLDKKHELKIKENLDRLKREELKKEKKKNKQLNINVTVNTNITVNVKKPLKLKKGDIFMHPIFWHPYILLKYKKKVGYWICGLMTSNNRCSEILEKMESDILADIRKENFFTRVVFTESNIRGKYMGKFDNKKQLKSLLPKLKKVIK